MQTHQSFFTHPTPPAVGAKFGTRIEPVVEKERSVKTSRVFSFAPFTVTDFEKFKQAASEEFHSQPGAVAGTINESGCTITYDWSADKQMLDCELVKVASIFGIPLHNEDHVIEAFVAWVKNVAPDTRGPGDGDPPPPEEKPVETPTTPPAETEKPKEENPVEKVVDTVFKPVALVVEGIEGVEQTGN